jgi:hypothetical protein
MSDAATFTPEAAAEAVAAATTKKAAKKAKAAPAAPAKKNKTATPLKGKSAARAKAAVEKASTAPKSKPMPDGKSVHADLPTREPKWSDRRKAVVLAMRKLGATGVTTAVPASKIAEVAAKHGAPEVADRVDLVKIILDVYRTAELLHNGFAASTRPEGSRELCYYLTKKGQTTKFPEVKPEAKPKAADEAAK